MAQQIRDIRDDLKARLDLLGPRRGEVQERYKAEIQEIDREEAMLRTLLAAEERLMAKTRVTVERKWAGNALENEILDILSNEGEWEHSEIKTALLDRGHGHNDDPKRFGQSIQGTLLSMSHRDLVESVGRGKWKITKYGLTGRVQPKEEDE